MSLTLPNVNISTHERRVTAEYCREPFMDACHFKTKRRRHNALSNTEETHSQTSQRNCFLFNHPPPTHTHTHTDKTTVQCHFSRSRWPRGLRRGNAAFHLLGLRVRILPGARISVSCECCVLSGRGLCVGLVTRPEESYRLCNVQCV